MDLTKLSTGDLEALKTGDLTKVSDAGLKQLQMFSRQAEQADKDRAEYDPTVGMSTGDKFLAGTGKAFHDVALGAKQLVGQASQEEVDENKQLSKPLMKTKAGLAGNVMGAATMFAPTALVPGAATLPVGVAMGGTQGFMQPAASDESRGLNTTLGAVVGGAVPAARAIGAGGKALVEPFTKGGRDKIAAETLRRFGIESADVANVRNGPTATGARTSLAEQIENPTAAAGAARLQDQLRTLDPKIAANMEARTIENNAARVNTLREAAGESGGRDFAAAERAGTSGPMYDEALKVSMKGRITPQLESQMRSLAASPDMKKAVEAAQLNAVNKGRNLASPYNKNGSVEGLHEVKLAIDDMIAQARGAGSQTAAQKSRAEGLESLQKRLVSFIEEVSPEYKSARTVHAQMSQPINQMDTAAELLKKGSSKTGDLGGNPRLMPNQLLGAAQDEAKLIKNATGRDLPQKTLSDLLDPDQYGKVRGVLDEVDKLSAVERAANGPGSATAQRMASQNVLREVLGPTGLPKNWSESTLLNTVMRPVQFAYSGVAEPRIQQTLAELMMEPEKVRAILNVASRGHANMLPEPVQAALPYLAQMVQQSAPAAALAGQR